MRPEMLVNVLEAAMLAAGRALTLEDFLALFTGHADAPDRAALRDALVQLGEGLAGRGIELMEVASGYRLQVREEYSPWLGGLFSERPPRYSRALLETLALIAYRQPITRGEIEDVRGVVVSSNIIKTLMEREWIRVLGHREVPGRPSLYGTTREFLDHFGLKSLEGLPPLADIRDLDQVEPDLFAPAPAEHIDSDGVDGDAPALLVEGESRPAAAQADTDGDDGKPSDAVDDDVREDAPPVLVGDESRPAASQAEADDDDGEHSDAVEDDVREDTPPVLAGDESRPAASQAAGADDDGEHSDAVDGDVLAQAPSMLVDGEPLAALSESSVGEDDENDENDVVLDAALDSAESADGEMSSQAGSDLDSVAPVVDEHHARAQDADDAAVEPAASERSIMVEQSTAQPIQTEVDDETGDGLRGESHGGT
ncbi:MAG: segregation and condensation protein B [Gammaproteobacteria bacterium]|jgi:segregation and condensation protein B